MSRSERRTARPCAHDFAALSARASGSKAIQLPPLSSPRDGPPQGPSGREPARDCDMHPSGGGCLSLVTSASDGYQPGLTPKCLGAMIAIGQSSTDSNLARNGDTRCRTSVADRQRPQRLWGRKTCHWAHRTIPRNTTTRNRRADAWLEPRLVGVPPWDLPRQQRPFGAGSRAPQRLRNAAKKSSNGLRSPGLRTGPAGGGVVTSGSGRA